MVEENVHKQRPRGGDEDAGDGDAGQATVADRKAEIDEEVDSLLDDIDEVLEENAAEFVASFVQKGGQ